LSDLEVERAVVVRLGETEFGIDVRRVREVLRMPAITRLPFPPPTILGIVSIRGTLVPVMDLGARLLGCPADRQGRLVVVRDPERDGSVGLLVDEVLDLAPMEEAAHEPPPEVEASLPSGWILGVLSPESSRLVTLLDLTHVLDLKTLAAEEKR
jgi:purine-binding chemotaxis protein CheW